MEGGVINGDYILIGQKNALLYFVEMLRTQGAMAWHGDVVYIVRAGCRLQTYFA